MLLKADESQCEAVCQILKRYEKVSRQLINFNKSANTFGRKVGDEIRGKIKEMTYIANEGGTAKYLGLPECFSGSKTEMLHYIQEKMKSRFHGWYSRYLSAGGKEVILKSVAMAMPVFVMSVFKLPKLICQNLTIAVMNFWWNSQKGRNKMHWISLEKMCLKK